MIKNKIIIILAYTQLSAKEERRTGYEDQAKETKKRTRQKQSKMLLHAHEVPRDR